MRMLEGNRSSRYSVYLPGMDDIGPGIRENGLIVQDSPNNILFARKFENFPDSVGVLDASILRMNRSSVDQRSYYSGEHRRHYIKLHALMDPNGMVMTTHDKKLFDVSWSLSSSRKRSAELRGRSK
jgi:hypothetical protein